MNFQFNKHSFLAEDDEQDNGKHNEDDDDNTDNRSDSTVKYSTNKRKVAPDCASTKRKPINNQGLSFMLYF